MGRKTTRPYRRKPIKTVNYSNETTIIQQVVEVPTAGSPEQKNVVVIPNVAQQGKKKAKNFTLRLKTNCDMPIFWALIYVPHGNEPSLIRLSPNGSLYKPAQNVIMSGIIAKNSAQDTFRSRLARNLNSGDRIALIVREAGNDAQGAGNYQVQGIMNYVIAF